MQQVGAALRRAGVAAVYLTHGTFVGSDALGVLSELARLFPSASKSVRRVIKRVVDKVAGDAGNYAPGYAQCFADAIHRDGQPVIPVRLFHWSSENHHIGRADGAVRLIDELASLDLQPSQRVLLWGHSHAGNVFALISNLLADNREAVECFFRAAEIYYRWPLVGCIDIPVWNRVHELLSRRPFRVSRTRRSTPLADVSLDMVTFGTPIRYGWDSAGYAKLLHFVNHRPAEGIAEYRAPFPPKLGNVIKAVRGDYVQQLGIAGTNVMPSVFSWRAWMADHRLNRVLQAEASKSSALERFQAGRIVPDEGTTLLVDYGRPDGDVTKHLAGHAVYTRKRWLLFHAEEIVRRLYGTE